MCLAIPGQILSITSGEQSDLAGRVNFSGISKEISLAYVPEAQVGDYVIVHAGFALNVLDTKEAQAVLSEFEAFTQMQQENP
jgi:hydrogenase expression/formation protein HypC